VAAAIDGHAATLIGTAVMVVAVLMLTAPGTGSVLGWAVRLTMSQLAAAGGLVIRALPVVLLTILVFFNAPVWLMASTISRGRLWLAVSFMVAIAAVFGPRAQWSAPGRYCGPLHFPWHPPATPSGWPVRRLSRWPIRPRSTHCAGANGST
jgi:hypothetical protein